MEKHFILLFKQTSESNKNTSVFKFTLLKLSDIVPRKQQVISIAIMKP